MALDTAQFGEYKAFLSDKGVRFQKTIDGRTRLIKESLVPAEVAQLLRKKMGAEKSAEPAKIEEKAEKPDVVQISVKSEEKPLAADDFDSPAGSQATEEPDAPVPVVDTDFLEKVSIHTADIHDIALALYDRFGIYTVWLDRYPVADEVNPLTAEPMTNYERGLAYQAALRAESRGLTKRDATVMKRRIDQNIEAQNNFKKSFVHVPSNLEDARRQNSFDWRTSVESSHDAPQAAPLEHYKDEFGETHVRRETNAVIQPNTSLNGSVTIQPIANPSGVFDQDEPISEPNLGLASNPIIRPDW